MCRKSANGREPGACGVILINDRVKHTGAADDLETFGRTTGPADAGILYVQVKEPFIDTLVRGAGKALLALERGIDADLRPRPFVIPNVEVRENVDAERDTKTVHNLVGY